MKTRNLEINLKLKVPHWVPYKNQWQALWKTVVYRLFPSRCHVCGVAVDFKGSEFEGLAGPFNQRVMLSQWTKDGAICPHCLAEKIKLYYAKATIRKEKQCDCCKQTKRVTAGITDKNDWELDEYERNGNKAVAKELGLDVRYGMAWWNGFDLCVDCVVDSLKRGSARSSYLMLWGKTSYYVNHRGALISPKRIKHE